MSYFFFSSRRLHTICSLVTGVQTCALPISGTERIQTHNVTPHYREIGHVDSWKRLNGRAQRLQAGDRINDTPGSGEPLRTADAQSECQSSNPQLAYAPSIPDQSMADQCG